MTSRTATDLPQDAFLCDCKKNMGSACEEEPFYREHEGKRYCVLHYPGTDKSADFKQALKRKLDREDCNFCGVWFPEPVIFQHFSQRADFRNATFNAEAYFNSASFNSTANFSGAGFAGKSVFVDAKFRADSNFSSTRFKGPVEFYKADFSAQVFFNKSAFSSGAYFESAEFSGTASFPETVFSDQASFSEATFNEAADFHEAKFGGEALFSEAKFNRAADFQEVKFGAEASFSEAKFNEAANFHQARFGGEASFSGTEFNRGADFREATFGDYARFAPPSAGAGRSDYEPSMDFQNARIDKPERVSFQSMRLRPQWFVNVDARKFEFSNVDWDWKATSIYKEIKDLKLREVASPYRMLSIACRDLADNAEENHRYEEASSFRFWSMDARRIEKSRGFAFWRLDWWFWAASGYGERSIQALLILIGIWLVFAVLYMRVGFSEAVKPLDTFFYSLNVILLQKPDPKPVTAWAKALVVLETTMGPLQAALFALAVRRKFMR